MDSWAVVARLNVGVVDLGLQLATFSCISVARCLGNPHAELVGCMQLVAACGRLFLDAVLHVPLQSTWHGCWRPFMNHTPCWLTCARNDAMFCCMQGCTVRFLAHLVRGCSVEGEPPALEACCNWP
jgi:hypothetical protein